MIIINQDPGELGPQSIYFVIKTLLNKQGLWDCFCISGPQNFYELFFDYYLFKLYIGGIIPAQQLTFQTREYWPDWFGVVHFSVNFLFAVINYY